MNPGKVTIDHVRHHKDYRFVMSGVVVYPGWATMEVYQHTNGTYWAATIYQSDDDSDYDYAKVWYEVTPRTKITYEAVK